MKRRRLQTALAALLALALVAGALALWRTEVWRVLANREQLLLIVEHSGPWGGVVIVVLEIAQVLLGPIPGQLVGIVAGYLYGPITGTLLCMVGLTLGTALAIWMARRLGRPLVERFASPALIERVDGYAQRRGAMAFFVIFLIPFLPDDLCCLIAGLTPLPIGEVLVLAIIGRAPGVIVSTLIGARARSLTWVEMALMGGGAILLAALFWHYRERLETAMFRVLDRWSQ